MRNVLFVLGKALCGVLLLQIAVKYIFLGPVGYVLQFVEKPAVLTASLLFFAGLALFLQSIGDVYDAFSKEKKPTAEPKKCQKTEIISDSLEPTILLDTENKHIKVLGKHKVSDFLSIINYEEIRIEEWTVSGQNETYINFPKKETCNSGIYYRIGDQKQNLPTETICE